jgi:hypothetical protein
MIREMQNERLATRQGGDGYSMPAGKLVLLFVLFFAICLGLGYPSLNRVDWRTAPGLTDVRCYVGMVTGESSACDEHMRFRVLVPAMARPVYRVTRGHARTWDPAMLGLLMADSLLVAGTAALLVSTVMWTAGDGAVALGAALLYLLNFAVPNLRLAGLIDAGEGFFLMAAVLCMLRQRWWMLPVIAVLGVMAKESFVPFLIALSGVWWLCEHRGMAKQWRAAAWTAAAWAAALATMTAVQWRLAHVAQSPVAFGLGMRGDEPWAAHLVHSFADRNLWYIFFWLLPLGVLRVGRLPTAWRVATAAAAVTAFAMDAYYGGQPGTIGRALFDVAGPMLSASAAVLLFGEFAGATRTGAAES